MRRAAAFVAGILASALLALSGMAWAVNGGGIPYFLRVGSLGLGTAAPTTTGAISQSFPQNSNFFNATDGTRTAFMFMGTSTTPFDIGTSTAHGMALYTNNTPRLTIDSAGNANFAGSLSANSHDAGQLHTYLDITAGSSTCTINGSQHENVSSCTFIGTGDARINFSTSYANPPICTGAGVVGGFLTMFNNLLGASVELHVENSSNGAATSGEVMVSCIGN